MDPEELKEFMEAESKWREQFGEVDEDDDDTTTDILVALAGKPPPLASTSRMPTVGAGQDDTSQSSSASGRSPSRPLQKSPLPEDSSDDEFASWDVVEPVTPRKPTAYSRNPSRTPSRPPSIRVKRPD